MGILGIENRTENWKTVQHFHGLSNEAKFCLVQELGEPAGLLAEEISLELFWKGLGIMQINPALSKWRKSITSASPTCAGRLWISVQLIPRTNFSP